MYTVKVCAYLFVCMQKWFECIVTAFDPSPNAYICKGFNNNNKSGKEEPVAVDLNSDLNERYVCFKCTHIETEHCYNYYFYYFVVCRFNSHFFANLFTLHFLHSFMRFYVCEYSLHCDEKEKPPSR